MANIMQMGDEARFLGSWDVMDGEITLTIADFKEETIEGDKGRKEKKCILYFTESGYKPMVCNLTNRKTLAKLYHTVNSEKLKGKRVTIGTDKVKAFGAVHDALRIFAGSEIGLSVLGGIKTTLVDEMFERLLFAGSPKPGFICSNGHFLCRAF